MILPLITGTLIWDSTLPDDAGWLLFSEQLHAGGPTPYKGRFFAKVT